jgi:hypothetical protein
MKMSVKIQKIFFLVIFLILVGIGSMLFNIVPASARHTIIGLVFVLFAPAIWLFFLLFVKVQPEYVCESKTFKLLAHITAAFISCVTLGLAVLKFIGRI